MLHWKAWSNSMTAGKYTTLQSVNSQRRGESFSHWEKRSSMQTSYRVSPQAFWAKLSNIYSTRKKLFLDCQILPLKKVHINKIEVVGQDDWQGIDCCLTKKVFYRTMTNVRRYFQRCMFIFCHLICFLLSYQISNFWQNPFSHPETRIKEPIWRCSCLQASNTDTFLSRSFRFWFRFSNKSCTAYLVQFHFGYINYYFSYIDWFIIL